MSRLTSPVEVLWTLVPERAPTVTRHCPRCDVARSFTSTEKFRINGHGRRVDAWLIYACPSCRFTWKLTLFTRVSPDAIGPERYRRFMDNDPAEALAVACDRALLVRAGVRPEPVPVRVEGPGAAELRAAGGWIRARVLPGAAALRLDRLLCDRLALSRSALGRLVASGAVQVEPADRRALKRPARAEQRYLLDAARIWPLEAPPVAASG